jgi:hypothetical protein
MRRGVAFLSIVEKRGKRRSGMKTNAECSMN